MRTILEGDKTIAGLWIGFARAKLRQLIAGLDPGETRASRRYDLADNLAVLVSVSDESKKIKIIAKAGEFIIICFVGDTTGDFSSKRFYDISGKEIARDEPGSPGFPPGWNLTDDGLYGPELPLDPLDPWNMTYAYNPGGLGIPSSGSGISPKKQAGRAARYILAGAIEDETFEAWNWSVGGIYSYNFVRQLDSLTYAPYSMYGPKPFFARYLGDQVVTMIVPWAGEEATLTWDAYSSDNFRDKLPKVHRIWKVAIADASRAYMEIDDYGDDSDAIIGAAGFLEDEKHRVRILRTKTQDWGGSKMAEPVSDETYNLTDPALSLTAEYHRCANPASELCYFYDAGTDSGRPADPLVPNTTAGSSIGDDVRVPHAIDETGKQTYVRIQKSGYFDSVNTGLYCGDALVEESGWEAVVKPHEPEHGGPLLIRNTRYRIIHVHADSDFKAVVYSKTKYVSHSDELLNYTALIHGDHRQARKTMIRSYTTYHCSVNGIITNLGYSNYRREYRITFTWDAVAALTQINAHAVELPWVDCGYDAAGNLLAEDNSCVMRCYTNTSKGMLFVGFDVYPISYRHDLVYDVHSNLTLDYREDVFMWPPSSDAGYANVKDRKWMLFSTSGNKIKDIQPPQKPDNGEHVNRINGLAFMGA